MTELAKKIFKGLRQVNLSTYKKCTDKEGFLWLVRDGEDRSIFFGNQKYASLSQTSSGGDPTEAITAAIENLIRQDLLHSFDSEGQQVKMVKKLQTSTCHVLPSTEWWIM